MALLLQKLHHSEDAAYERGQQDGRNGKRTSSLPGTRVKILNALDQWLDDSDGPPVYWLNGMAGTGKSTIADSLYRAARQADIPVAGFFCSRDYESARKTLHIFSSLAHQLAFPLLEYR